MFCNDCRIDTKFKMILYWINTTKYYKCTCTKCGYQELNRPDFIIKQITDIDAIPKGEYCYNGNYRCPHWSLKKDLPRQSNGYCAYLYMSDVNIWDKEKRVGLLWDSVKECGINI